MRQPQRKIVTLDELVAIRGRLAAERRTVVQCHGCFDIVHPGHVRYLKFARDQGDVLVVSITADEVVGKGPERPYVTEQLRAENVAAFEFVDYVLIDPHGSAEPILRALRPDIYVKGKEYESKGDPRFAREKALVEDYGGKVIFSSGDVVYSSSYIISRFRDRFQLDHEQVRSFTRRHGLSRSRLETGLRRFNGLRVLVLGDPILDRYVHCNVLGVASESPVLSVTPLREELYPGAGALIARQMAALGADVTFMSAIGDGAEADQFEQVLARSGVKVARISTDNRPLYVKTRFLVDERKVFKVDSGRRAPLSSAAARDLVGTLRAELARADGLVATDFGYGLFPAEVVQGIAEACSRAGKPYFVDVSHTGHANVLKFVAPRLAAPTESELRFALGDDESGLSHLAARYFEATGADRLVLTLGRRGLLMFSGQKDAQDRLPTDYLPAIGTSAVDEVGAGDILLSLLVLAELSGEPSAVGAYLGACAASLRISRVGNEPVALEDLLGFLDSRGELRA